MSQAPGEAGKLSQSQRQIDLCHPHVVESQPQRSSHFYTPLFGQTKEFGRTLNFPMAEVREPGILP